ncbi:MAG: ABC transporter substrate-binding protein [Betaproteobacteria bacterium]|nr:MAG: ABC transporter substrate-binding protein [Betaproteobacteria bacterium]
MTTAIRAALVAVLIAYGAPVLASKADDTVNVGFRLQLQGLDTYYSPGREGLLLAFWVWDALVYRDSKTFEMKPLIASSWKQVDARTLDFVIRPGIKFHDGSTLTAKDVVFTLNFVSKPENKVFNQAAVSWIENATAIGPDTVRVRAKQVTPLALSYLMSVPIYPADYYQRVGREGMAAKPVGSGPFRAEPGPDSTVIFTRFDDYFAASPKGKAGARRVIYRTIPEINTQVAELISGRLDWAYYVPDDQAERLRRLPNLRVAQGESFRVAYLTMDAAGKAAADSPLKDVRVRRAISHALDRQGVVKNLMGGSQVIHTPCYPKQFGCVQEVTKYNYDVAKARSLMAEAGRGAGFNLDIYAYRNRQVAEAIIGNLRAIGITANLRWVQYPAMVQKRRSNEAPMVVDDWGSNSIDDVGAILPVFFNSGPDDYAMDPAVTAMVARGSSTTDRAARQAAYADALKRIADQAYVVPLFTMPVTYVFNAGLEMPVPNDEIPEFWRARWK